MNKLLAAGLSMLATTAIAAEVPAAAPLFPKPIHLVRVIDDSLAGGPVQIDEYYSGDRAITIRGDRTAIADYAKQELTEIDRTRGTWSVVSFAQLAAAQSSVAPPQAKHAAANSIAAKPSMDRKGSDHRAGRSVELYAGGDDVLRAEVAVDPSVTLSKEAFDVVAGAAFPKNGGAAAELLRGAARNRTNVAVNAAGGKRAESYGLPVEQTMHWTVRHEALRGEALRDEAVVVANRVLSIDDRQPAAELIAIPPGARRVEARAVEAARLAAETQPPAPALPSARH
jgi:hypothetical protein